jgi:protein-S-isoprenylcysteine O-methyltransferase Ste14
MDTSEKDSLQVAKKVIGIFLVVVAVMFLFLKVSLFNRGSSVEYSYQNVMGVGIIGVLLVFFYMKFIDNMKPYGTNSKPLWG